MSQRILCLDLGRRTGWAIYNPKQAAPWRDSGVYELYDPNAGDKQPEYDDTQRFAALARFVMALHEAAGPLDVVVFEQVNGGTKGRQTQLINGYRAVVMLVASQIGAKCVNLPVGTIKKGFAGHGGADKAAMIAAAVKLGYRPFDDNEADAIAVMHTYLRMQADSVKQEEALASADKGDLSQFKMQEKPKKEKKSKKTVLTLEHVPSIVVRSSSNTGVECSSDSQESAKPAKPRRRKLPSPTLDSPLPNSQPPSSKSRGTATA